MKRRASSAVGVVCGVLVLGIAVAAAAAAFTGASQPLAIGDPGHVVRWGLPVLGVVSNLAAALTIGMLVLAAVALPVRQPAARVSAAVLVSPAAPAPTAPTSSTAPERHGHVVPYAYPPALLWAAAASAVWAVATLATAVLTYADIAGIAVSDPDFGHQLASFVTTIDLGRGLLVTAAVAAAVSTLAAGAATLRAAGLLALLAMVGLIPPALGGHSAGASDHETAVTSLGMHLLGVCVWVGGLVALAVLWPGLSGRSEAAVAATRRYSTLAGWAFAVVAGSGAVNAWIRIGGLGGLGTRYGIVVLLKMLALVVLGGLGWQHRRSTLTALAAGRAGAFARLVAVELAVMAVGVGLAAALARSAPPVAAIPPANPTLAQSITGYPLPPEPTALRWLTQWQPDLLWLSIAGVAAVLYLVGAARLHRRGDRWPVTRTLAWMSGLAVLTWATSGGPAVYGRVLFSAHMLGHMTLSMAAPMLLVLAAPLTLALRVLPSRHDGTRGAREWLLAVLESWYLRLLAQPVVAALLFAGSLIAFYYSDLFQLALTTHVGHELMDVHFLLVGYLFMWVLMGVDPGPTRPAPPLRMLLLLATMGFHAFFGVALMASKTVLAGDYFGGLGRTWGDTLLGDQRYGASLAWAIGDIPTLVVALVIAVQWARTDDREARRLDRAADRDGDAELNAYNAMLARIAEQDSAAKPPTSR